MRLGKIEFIAMNNPIRRFMQKNIEFRLFKRFLLENKIDLKNKVIIDAGCGSGYSSKLIVNEFEPSQLIAFDYMPEQIEIAEKRELDVDFFVGDVRKLELEDNISDAAFIFGVLHHIPEWKTALKEISRILKPNGVLLIEEPEVNFNWIEFEQGIKSSGFNILNRDKVLSNGFQSFLCQKQNLKA
ncbi:MAG: class I SAM-dependent methyltransferase [Methanobacterium sp.]